MDDCSCPLDTLLPFHFIATIDLSFYVLAKLVHFVIHFHCVIYPTLAFVAHFGYFPTATLLTIDLNFNEMAKLNHSFVDNIFK